MKADCDQAVKRLAAVKSDDPVAQFPLGKLQGEGKI